MSKVQTNPLTIGCPRAECRSTVIRPNIATLVWRQPPNTLPGFGQEQSVKPIVPIEISRIINAEPPREEKGSWFWCLKDMMAFENVGFSKLVDNVKFLSCADCNLAPIGYHDTADKTNKEYLVAVDRVVYRK
ncbi:Mss4-like protein [Coemansia reversa NRRL 1564]|uniref:Mss4-like protein n=1 Tax=Coemansia reversa (strain ATCC 12441 / NRRL 1564) TaxID=763665 RepID=A0A2G5B8L7_COERN|nr:Mss4-like protein [Coemansia reversa NRRL 1564]|eukprot:PIA15077.1 Mss4-like protein [Coemansia reversa NRRL 1564]